MLKKIFAEALPSLAKATASVVKDHKGKVSSKRVFSVLGGGSLITAGLTVIDSGLESGDDKILLVGLGLVGMGVVAGYLASFNIKEISTSADDKK
jgi:hypothetical protein